VSGGSCESTRNTRLDREKLLASQRRLEPTRSHRRQRDGIVVERSAMVEHRRSTESVARRHHHDGGRVVRVGLCPRQKRDQSTPAGSELSRAPRHRFLVEAFHRRTHVVTSSERIKKIIIIALYDF